MKRWLRTYFAALSMLVLAAGAVAGPAAAAPGGNSDNAQACHKGGWESLARTEDPGTAFLDQDECVSYGAQGGTLVPYVPVVLNPAIYVSFDPTGDPRFCLPQVDLVDFAANTEYVVTSEISYFSDLTSDETYVGPQTTDGAGFWSGYPIGSYLEREAGVNWFRVTANGITTDWYDIEC